MKKTFMMLAILAFAYSGTNAQVKTNGKKPVSCGKNETKVCRPSSDKKSTICYNTPYAQNFEICKNDLGYFVCCETPGPANSTFSGATRSADKDVPEFSYRVNCTNTSYSNTGSEEKQVTTAPQGQSYPWPERQVITYSH